MSDHDTAADILEAARLTMAQRARDRDRPNGERSMARTVVAFNALTGHRLTETEGWRFMELLKIARGDGPDEFVDGCSYAALAGEAASKARVRRAPDERG